MSPLRTLTATRFWLKDLRRRPVLLVLLVVTPVFFITRAIAATEPLPRRITVADTTVVTTMRDIHGANMAAITVAFLGGLVGVFIMQAARQADRRLVLAGFRSVETVVSRLVVLLAATAVVIAVALVVTARDFTPEQWGWFAFGTAAIGITYAGLGALAGALFGRVAATYLLLIGSMLDIGVVENPMFGTGKPPGWAVILPGYSAIRIVNTAAFSHVSPTPADVAGALIWMAAVLVAVVGILSIAVGTARRPGTGTSTHA